ncbi:MAG: class II aldolase/adducin family protein [Beijerinckiaceae bacterium]
MTSQAVAQLIDDLVIANRILAKHGVLDAWGHVSVRHPERTDRFLMSRARAPALIRAEDVMEFDMDSEPVAPDGRRVFLERFIHGQTYRARRDVNAVVHSHSPTTIPFGVAGEPMRGVSHMASFMTQDAPVWDIREAGVVQGLLVATNAQGESLARKLGSASMALMRGHGNIVVAENLKLAVQRAIYTEVNAKQLAIARSFNRPITYIAPDEAHEPKRLDDAWEVWRNEVVDDIENPPGDAG